MKLELEIIENDDSNWYNKKSLCFTGHSPYGIVQKSLRANEKNCARVPETSDNHFKWPFPDGEYLHSYIFIAQYLVCIGVYVFYVFMLKKSGISEYCKTYVRV